MSDLMDRTVHVKGFQAPINPAALQAGMSRFGRIDRMHLWTSASGKEHAFIVYRDAGAVDEAVGAYKAVTVEHIRNSPDLQARLRDMSESWTKRIKAPVKVAGEPHASVQDSGRQAGRLLPHYSDPRLHPVRMSRPGGDHGTTSRDGDRSTLASRSDSRRAFEDSGRDSRSRGHDPSYRRRNKSRDTADFDYNFSKDAAILRKRSRERSPRRYDPKQENEGGSRRRESRDTLQEPIHRARSRDKSTHHGDYTSRREERSRKGRSPTPVDRHRRHPNRSGTSPRPPKTRRETKVKEPSPRTEEGTVTSKLTFPKEIPLSGKPTISSPRPVIKVEDDEEPMVIEPPCPIQGFDRVLQSDTSGKSGVVREESRKQAIAARDERPNTTSQCDPLPSRELESEAPVPKKQPPSPTTSFAKQPIPPNRQLEPDALLSVLPASGTPQEIENHVTRVIREAYKEDASDAHMRSCLLIIEYANKALWSLADLVGRECVTYYKQRKTLGLSTLPMKPIYLALATCKAKQARVAKATEKRKLMLTSAAFITSAEEAEEKPVSLNFIRLNLLENLSVPASGTRDTEPRVFESVVPGSSCLSQSSETSWAKSSPGDGIPTQPRSRPFEMQALRMQVTSLQSNLTLIRDDIRAERVSKRKAEDDLQQERSKVRRIEGEVKRFEDEKRKLEGALDDEKARRTKAEDEVWLLKRAEFKPKPPQPIPSWSG